MKNFVVVGAVHLSIDGGEIRDFHNTFDFSGVCLDFAERIIEYKFTPYKNEHNDSIDIQFSGVNYFQFTENPFTENPTEVEELGYKELGDDNLDWIAGEVDYSEGMHFVVRLGNDSCLRIGADKMTAKILDARPASSTR